MMPAVYKLKKPVCTTGTSIVNLLESTDAWVEKQLEGLSYGDIQITYCVANGFVTHIKKCLTETEQRNKT
jgi:hypothetical protein